MKAFLTFSACVFVSLLHAQPGTVRMTPVVDGGLQRTRIETDPRFYSKTDTSKLYINLPAGWKAKMFYTGGLTKTRLLTFSPGGVLHASDMHSSNGKIYALPDQNDDGVADTAIVVASGFSNNHDVKFYKGAMYVTESSGAKKLTDADNDNIYENKTTFISGIPTGGHVTRTLVFDSLNQKAYLSIGSSCNVCRESNRAIIEQYNEDGTGKRTYATGVRNAVGMTMHPHTNKLWANNNGSDNQGDYIPPEWTDIVRDGGFYGHPFAYANQVWFNINTGPADYQNLKPITSTDSANVASMVEPAALIQAHSAPMAIQFLNSSFPAKYRNGLLMALRGSWNTNNNHKGYKVVYMDLSDANDTSVNFVSDFVTGFITDTIARTFWGRPVGLAVDQRGRIFMSSDEANRFILMLYNTMPDGVEDENIGEVLIYPNPYAGSFRLRFELKNEQSWNFRIYDVQGRLISSHSKTDAGSGVQELETGHDLRNGVYIYELRTGTAVKTGRIIRAH